MIATKSFSHSFTVHQIRFRPGFRPGPRWGSLQRSAPQPPQLNFGEEVGKEKGKGNEGKGEGGG